MQIRQVISSSMLLSMLSLRVFAGVASSIGGLRFRLGMRTKEMPEPCSTLGDSCRISMRSSQWAVVGLFLPI